MQRPYSRFPDRPRKRGPDVFIAFCGMVVAVIFLAVAVMVFTTVFYPETIGRFFRSIVDGYQGVFALPLPLAGRTDP